VTDFPQHLKVGPVVYRVLEMSYQVAAVQDIDGVCETGQKIIRVREDLNRDDKARILLHEILHAAWDMGNLADSDGEEKTVAVLANQLTQIWRDNPDFVAFMNDALQLTTD
jgi:hypothetical protein